jgi:hypothetical protein
MQLGAKGAKNKAELLDALGGAPVPEEAAPLMVRKGSTIYTRDGTDTWLPLLQQSHQDHYTAAAPSPTVQTPTAPAAPTKPENPFGPIDEEE